MAANMVDKCVQNPVRARWRT